MMSAWVERAITELEMNFLNLENQSFENVSFVNTNYLSKY